MVQPDPQLKLTPMHHQSKEFLEWALKPTPEDPAYDTGFKSALNMPMETTPWLMKYPVQPALRPRPNPLKAWLSRIKSKALSFLRRT